MDRKIVTVALIVMAIMFIGLIAILSTLLLSKQSENASNTVSILSSTDIKEYDNVTMSAFEVKDLVNSKSLGINKPIIILMESSSTSSKKHYYGNCYSSSTNGGTYKSTSGSSNFTVGDGTTTLYSKTNLYSIYMNTNKYLNINDDVINANSSEINYKVSTIYLNKTPIGLLAIKQ